MVDALVKEIAIQKSYLDDEPLDTIYFGGGTPSILEINDLNAIFRTVNDNFTISPDPEITLEANPDDLTREKLLGLRRIGVNRLSVGIQSFNDRVLKFLNRAHDSSEAIECIKNARKAGFNNLSIDLIFSIPGNSIHDLERDIETALNLDPEHLSAYSLTVEEKTVFGNWQKKGKLVQITDEVSAHQFDLLISQLEARGYEQYEISNFCRDNKYAIHNTSYWKNISYLGIGPGAHSYNGVSRQSNVCSNPKYIKSLARSIVPSEIEVLDDTARANEFLLTSLRTKWGCDLNRLHRSFGYDIRNDRSNEILHCASEGLIKIEHDIMYLTRKGRFLADEIIAGLFRDQPFA